MYKSIKQNRKKQLYSSKIFSIAPEVYETYKKMQKSQSNLCSSLNTSQTSLETINRIPDNFAINKKNSSKYKPINNQKSNKNNKNKNTKPHLSYIGFLKSKGYPVITNEKRFKWQNLEHNDYPTGTTVFHKIKRNYKNNNCKEEYKFKKAKKCVPYEWSDMSLNKTKRVFNTDINDKNNDDIFNKSQKSLKFEKIDGLRSLIKKTPLKYDYKGIRILKKSNSLDLNLFIKDYAINDIPKVRKHFAQKDKVKDICFNSNKSMDSIKIGKCCKQFKKYIGVNPLNWRIFNYKNFY